MGAVTVKENHRVRVPGKRPSEFEGNFATCQVVPMITDRVSNHFVTRRGTFGVAVSRQQRKGVVSFEVLGSVRFMQDTDR